MTGRMRRRLRFLEFALWLIAAIALGLYGWVYLDRSVYQAYKSWAFERELDNEPAPVLGFILHSLRFGADEGRKTSAAPDSLDTFTPKPDAVPPPSPAPRRAAPPKEQPVIPGDGVVGRIEIPRIGVRAMILQGTGSRALRRAVGHIEGTAMPGNSGNVGLAGHRDTFFRGLRDIRRNDAIRIRTLEGTYTYAVVSIRIVGPQDVAVLNATSEPVLTLVTCYPFNYTGPAPRRYIVRAREISAEARSGGEAAR